jgi:predicted ferric reductase
MVEVQNVRNLLIVARVWLILCSNRKHRYVRLLPSKNMRYLERTKAFIKAIAFLPTPRVFGCAITILPLGPVIVLATYCTLGLFLLTLVDAPVFSDHFLDDVAFRGAWISLTQIPLIYFLSTKRGPVNLLSGFSHERINWLHRWIGRMLFVSTTTHVVIMKSSISTKDILHSPDPTMSVVRYGIATYAVLIWIALTSIIPVRRFSYRIFYINHYVSTLVFLVIAFQHIPSYARPPIYLSASIVALDKTIVSYFFIRNNLSVGPRMRRFARTRSGRKFVLGVPARMATPSAAVSRLPAQTKDATTVVRISSVPFSWKPGQHVRLSIPAIGCFEMHPFTPANCSVIPAPPLPPRKDLEPGNRSPLRQTSDMLLMIKSKSGFTKRLADYYTDWLARPCPNATKPADESLTAYIDGPYGAAPEWHQYENLVLIASSTGVSFILSILDHLEQLCFSAGPEELKTRSVKLVWTTRHLDPSFEEVVKDVVKRCSSTLRDLGVKVEAEFWNTCPRSAVQETTTLHFDPFAHLRPGLPRTISDRPALRIRNPDEIYDEWDREAEEWAKKHYEPFSGDIEELDVYAEESEEDSDETGTLIDGQEERRSAEWTEEDPFADPRESQHDDAYRPLPQARRESREVVEVKMDECQCAVIQHQRRKLNRKATSTEYIVERHGSRPDVCSLLDGEMPPVGKEKTIVAVCGNSNIVRDVRTTTSRINMDFAMGRRKGGVDVHIENQS